VSEPEESARLSFIVPCYDGAAFVARSRFRPQGHREPHRDVLTVRAQESTRDVHTLIPGEHVTGIQAI